MGFFRPLQLLWLILAVGAPLLYLAIRRRKIDVSSHAIWQRALAGSSAWRRWQRWISAVVMAGLLAALALVLAEPYWQRDRDAARTMVLVLDTAASEGDARQSAVAAVDGMKLYERMAILAASEPTRVLCPLTADRAELLQTIATSKTDLARSISPAIKLAEWMLAAERNPTVIVCAGPQIAKTQPETSVTALQGPADSPGVWLLASALVLCCGEWLLFSRRVTV